VASAGKRGVMHAPSSKGAKFRVPWYAKVIGKIILSRIPWGYDVWRKVGLFSHGDMSRPAYAYEVFRTHYDRVTFPGKERGFVMLELGPGDSLFSALIAHVLGARSSFLIDSGSYARKDITSYQQMAEYLTAQGFATPDLSGLKGFDDLLALCSAKYGTQGLDSLKAIPDGSVDFVWSQAVLEHIRRDVFLETMSDLRRVIKSDGICSHRIDLQDHLDGSLNNLRFSRRLWESDFMARSGFYTNRIRSTEMMSFFKNAGFEPNVIEIRRWEHLPTPRAQLDPEFRVLSEDELRVSGFDVVLKPQ
jgi:SAM-dependent methyltransferase